jgi:hypothetical protein
MDLSLIVSVYVVSTISSLDEKTKKKKRPNLRLPQILKLFRIYGKAFVRKSCIVFVLSVKNAIPNEQPQQEGHPSKAMTPTTPKEKASIHTRVAWPTCLSAFLSARCDCNKRNPKYTVNSRKTASNMSYLL